MPEDAIGVRPYELVTAEDKLALERDSGKPGILPDVAVLASPSSPSRVPSRARVQGPMLSVTAVVMAAALLLAGCGASQQTAGPPTVASGQGNNSTPGITCLGGLHFDEALGCTREVAPGRCRSG